MQQPVFLVGFMGAGKSHVGRRLADYLYRPFLDLDQYLEKRAGRPITRIFSESGEAWFRLLERRALHDTAFRVPGVIATGGGTPCFYDNMDWMNRRGVVIFLDVETDVLEERLWRGRRKRPLLAELSRSELRAYITRKTSERRPYYIRAHVHYSIREDTGDAAAEISRLIDSVTGH